MSCGPRPETVIETQGALGALDELARHGRPRDSLMPSVRRGRARRNAELAGRGLVAKVLDVLGQGHNGDKDNTRFV